LQQYSLLLWVITSYNRQSLVLRSKKATFTINSEFRNFDAKQKHGAHCKPTY
jgi:hypothetical protein